MDTKQGWDKHWDSQETIQRLSSIDTAYPEVVKLLLNLTDENSECIELGCGSGTYSIEMLVNNRKCIATDFSEQALELTRIKGKKLYGLEVPTKVVDIYDIPYPDNCFDLAFSDGVIEHLDIPRALREMRRVVKPNGWIVAKVPSGSLLYKTVYYLLSPIENRPYEAWFSKKEWCDLVMDAGYEKVCVTDCGSVLVGFAMRIPHMRRALKFIPRIGRIYYLIKAKK